MDTRDILDELCTSECLDVETFFACDALPTVNSLRVGVSDVLGVLEEEVLGIMKGLYKERLHKSMPRSVVEWLKGSVPSLNNRVNNFDLCFALGLSFEETKVFFEKYFYSLAFNYKNYIDAVYAYALKNHKDYAFVEECLASCKMEEVRDFSDTCTVEIEEYVLQCADDGLFLEYLKGHCLSRELFYARARDEIKGFISLFGFSTQASLHEALMGFNFQLNEKELNHRAFLPKEFVTSLPNDGTLGRIVNDRYESYETLRKTLMILSFYDFYKDASQDGFEDEDEMIQNLMDFYEEMDQRLLECGFTSMYVKNPFDYLLLYCAKSESPLHTFYELNDLRFEE